MKIRKLSFRNINNLKGDHQIDFGTLPLKSAGIFAITGPTGSGKSTILDVITLSLFNRVPRFKRPISKGEIQGLGSILTHHTSEASAAIEYEIKGQVYVSAWTVSKARTGNLKDYEMTLMDSTGSFMDLKRSEVPARNEEIIGLKYDQFIKSIILSQGEFSRFLKADKNERGQLLENLTGTSIYRKIGIQTYQKFKEVTDRTRLEKEKLAVIQPLSPEVRNEIAEAIKKADGEANRLHKELAQQESLVAVKTELVNVRKELEQNQAEKNTLKQQSSETKADEQRLSQHEKLSSYQGDLTLYKKTQVDKQNLTRQIAESKEQQLSVQNQINQLTGALSELTSKTVEKKDFLTVMNQFEDEVIELDRVMLEKRKLGQEQRSLINQKTVHYHLNIGEKVAPKEGLSLLTADHDVLSRKLSSAGLDRSVLMQEARQSLRVKQKSLELLKDLTRVLFEQQQLVEGIKADKDRSTELSQKVTELKPLIEKGEKLLNQLKQTESLLLKQKEDAIKIAELESLRPELVDGEPCPLCGSLHHPYSAHSPADTRSEIDQKLDKVRQDLIDETKQLELEKEKLTTYSAEHHHLESSITKLSSQLTALTRERDELKGLYSGGEVLEFEQLKTRLPVLAQQNQEFEEAIDALEQIGINEELSRAFKAFEETIGDYQKIAEKRANKYEGKDVKTHCDQLRAKFQTALDNSLRLETATSSFQNQLAHSSEELFSLQKKLEPVVSKHNLSSIEELSALLLTDAEADRIRKVRESLQKDITANEAREQQLYERLSAQQAQDTAPETTLEQARTLKDKNSMAINELNVSIGSNKERLKQDDKDREQIADRADAIEKLEAELKKWSLLNKMIGDAMGHKFSNFAQGLTLQNLLVYANRRLKKLSDRYLLIKPNDDGALKVLDQYQGNSERSVSTLSGGETFLLSLALALSLSDMASKNVSLDSLFIDEGFGTLDQETLDVAMTTLERLQSESQKTVGVISHVEALKERITVQIQLEKNSLGYSHIKVQ